MTLPSRIDWRDDRGQAGGAEAVPLGILVFVIGTLMVTNLWSVIDMKAAVNAAAREAAHAVAEAQSGADAATAGDAAARDALTTYLGGHDPGPDAKVVDLVYTTSDSRNGWQRCAGFTLTVRHPAPLIRLPLIGAFGTSVAITSSAGGVVDPYRSSAGVTEEEREGRC